MGFGEKPVTVQEKQTQGRTAIEYLREGRNAQAYVLLSEMGTDKDPSSCFALGLCHFRAGDLTEAISFFEQALDLIKAMPQGFASNVRAENSETYKKLSIGHIANKIYLNPMDKNFCTQFPKAAEQNILLALIDMYKNNGMKEHARRLSSALTGPVFEAYKKELMEN